MLRSSFWSLLVLEAIGLSAGARAQPQDIKSVLLASQGGLLLQGYTLQDGSTIRLATPLPCFSFEINDTLFSSGDASAFPSADTIAFRFRRGIEGRVFPTAPGWMYAIVLSNHSSDTLIIANLVPLGIDKDRVYICAGGPRDWPAALSRSQLHRPGYGPIGVVLPDDAWELGFCDVPVSEGRSLVALARREDVSGAEARRFRSIIPPGGSVRYRMAIDQHGGDWHEGLRIMFQERWLYDLPAFDNRLFERTDLNWIRHSYLALLQFAWDQTYYDALRGVSPFDSTFAAEDHLLGGYDIFMLWPTWPRLGLDERNQFDLYRDLPGGIPELHRQAELAHRRGEHYFISYNPWDEDTRHEEHLAGMESLLRSINADGVVLDTRGASSTELQQMADRVKPGIVMYSEGMAVPKDMPGIVAGRVHDALLMPPPLNLNKFIKPEFAIFRVLQVSDGTLHREIDVAFFNGYGTELNVMRAGRPPSLAREFEELGRTTMILRENSAAFLSTSWTPLLPTSLDSVYVNRWPVGGKTVYTIYSLRPEGVAGPLFAAARPEHAHYVSLWRHEEIDTAMVGRKSFIPVNIDGFNRASLGTRQEGNLDCIALLPDMLSVELRSDSISFTASEGTRILVSVGAPSYREGAKSFSSLHGAFALTDFGRPQEKYVVKLFDGTELIDERVVHLPHAYPLRITRNVRTVLAARAPEGMVEIPGGEYTFSMPVVEEPNPIIPSPDFSTPRRVFMKRFFMDRFPVTNAMFLRFVSSTEYRPRDTTNFLRHWRNGRIPPGMGNHPVVWVSLEDARAYARWAGKRLPADIEWQYAAQGTDGRLYPWGNVFDSTRCNEGLGHTTRVDAHPTGASPYGVMDLVGNVWQLTDDVYDDGSYYFGILRGGSYYSPTSSIWYVTGGPLQVNRHQMFLMVSPGFDRSSTVGFRCVMDALEPTKGK